MCANPALFRSHLKFYSLPLQFVVVRFCATEEDDDEYFEVGLGTWLLGELNDDMMGYIRWPPKNKPATPLVKVQSPVDPEWSTYKIQVMRFYGKM